MTLAERAVVALERTLEIERRAAQCELAELQARLASVQAELRRVELDLATIFGLVGDGPCHVRAADHSPVVGRVRYAVEHLTTGLDRAELRR